jgi:hypothetical protein
MNLNDSTEMTQCRKCGQWKVAKPGHDLYTFVCNECEPSRYRRQYESERFARPNYDTPKYHNRNDGVIFVDVIVDDPQEYADPSAYLGNRMHKRDFMTSLPEKHFDGLKVIYNGEPYNVKNGKLVTA